MSDKDLQALDRLLDEVLAEPVAPSAAFLARITEEGLAEQPPAPRAALPVAEAPAPRGGWLAAIGGWPALGGLVLATLSGVWIGVAPPAALVDAAGGLLGYEQGVTLFVDSDPLAALEG